MQNPAVVYEDENFLAVNKPAGLLVHGTPKSKKRTANGNEKTLVDWLVEHFPEIKSVGDDPQARPGIVHRLDRDTSGVMLVARNQRYFEYLKSLFQKREIKKTYLALVWGGVEPRRGIIEKSIKLKSGTAKRTVHEGKMEKMAATEYRVIKNFFAKDGSDSADLLTKSDFVKSGFAALLEVHPLTGRTHQIRVHLASIGHPIVGDRLYGSRQIPNSRFQIPGSRLMLHALSLEFTTAEGKRIRVEAAPPPEMVID